MTWRIFYRCRLSTSAQLWNSLPLGCQALSLLSALAVSLLSLLLTHKTPCLWVRCGPCTSDHGWIASPSHHRWPFHSQCSQWWGLPFPWRSCKNRWTCLFGSALRIFEPGPNSHFPALYRLICRRFVRSRTLAVRRVEEWSSWENLSSIMAKSGASILLFPGVAWN